MQTGLGINFTGLRDRFKPNGSPLESARHSAMDAAACGLVDEARLLKLYRTLVVATWEAGLAADIDRVVGHFALYIRSLSIDLQLVPSYTRPSNKELGWE